MSSLREVKKRIKSVKNTAQITKAMEAVSATKMRKSQEFALRARPYAFAGLNILKNLLVHTQIVPELLQNRKVKNKCLLVVTSDKGLAGAFNSNVLKKAENWLNSKKKQEEPFYLVTVGKKTKDYFERRGFEIFKSFTGFGDFSALKQTMPVADLILNGFKNGQWDEVEAIYTNFRTTLKQEVFLRKILPVRAESVEEIISGLIPERGRYAENLASQPPTTYNYEYKFEPSPDEILNNLIPQLLRMNIHHLILESNASEHSARMVAMKNASDNAKELIGDLTLDYNKLRQANITRELIEITAGAEVLR
ncbi:MAG: ATP synthase F1 subunit gamma [bacterium]|nr:ATP synthase F1 subunit gamma [bacterium]